MPKIKFSKIILVIIFAVTIYLMYLLSTHQLPLGVPDMGQWQWFWRTNSAIGNREIFVIIVSICLGVFMAYLLERSKSSKVIKILTFILLILIYFGLVYLIYNSWEMAMWIRRHGDLPYFVYAHDQQKTLILDIIRQYLPSVITNSNPHTGYEIARSSLGTHPPGSTMLFVFADRLTQLFWPALPEDYMYFSYHAARIVMIANMIPITGLLILVKIISGSWQKALRAVSLFVLLPSFVFFFLSPSAMETTAVIYLLIFLVLAIRSEKKWFWIYTVFTSIILALATFVNFGLIALYGLLLILLVIYLLFRKISFRKALMIFLTSLAIFVLWLYISDLFLNYNYFVGWHYSQLTHHDMIGERKYFPWVYMNVYDFFMFLSFPLSLLFFLFIPKIFKDQKFITIAFTLIALLTLGIIDILGIARGEVARIWLFLTPLFVIPPALLIDEYKNSFTISAIIYSAILLQLVVMNTFIFVVYFPH